MVWCIIRALFYMAAAIILLYDISRNVTIFTVLPAAPTLAATLCIHKEKFDTALWLLWGSRQAVMVVASHHLINLGTYAMVAALAVLNHYNKRRILRKRHTISVELVSVRVCDFFKTVPPGTAWW